MKLMTAIVLMIVPVLVSAQMTVEETDKTIALSTPQLSAGVKKTDYVTGIAAGSFVDQQTGFHDAGYGLDIVDWIMEPGSDAAYRDKLPREMVYEFNNAWHGKTAKRSIEGPQICTQAKTLAPAVIRGEDFVAIRTDYHYKTAAPGMKAGSKWEQTIVFPVGKRYFISSDKITSVNDLVSPFLRLDMPGHIKHKGADTFSEVYLSYVGKIPAAEFDRNFAPDEKFTYLRGKTETPKRFIRAYHLRDAKTGKDGPWLAGMTLKPELVTEAWCHERGYVCMIEEFGPVAGKAIKTGESFSAAYVVGYFDSIQEMEKVYDQYAGAVEVTASEKGWKLLP